MPRGIALFLRLFFHHAARENKKEMKTPRPDRSLGGGFKDSLFYPLQECVLVHPCNFPAGDQSARNLPQKRHLQRHLAEETDKP